MQLDDKWWKRAVIYQIYPRSFCDGNGDGVGDIRGIIGKIDYLSALGVDAVWLSPVYRSPGVDNGYDISDYTDIDPVFGTMDDFDEMAAAFKKAGIKLIMDFVINHTSVEHKWFRESRKSLNNPYRDYYIWHKGKFGDAPCNWTSVFGGSAWTRDDVTGEYYFHLFTDAQPDLNWQNPAVREEIVRIGEFWAKKGVDGLRIDCANFLAKDRDFCDVTEDFDENMRKKFINFGPIHEYYRFLNERLFSKYHLAVVGECSRVTPQEAKLFTDEKRREMDMIFQFEHVSLEEGEHGKWNRAKTAPKQMKESLIKWQTEMTGSGWNSLYFDNHDQPRMVSRFGNDGMYRDASAKMLAILLMSMQGTPFVYQGSELAMKNTVLRRDQLRDCEAIGFLAENDKKGYYNEDEALAIVNLKGRDTTRTPMPWTAQAGAGFTSGAPWIAMDDDYKQYNAAAQQSDPHSVWHFYRDLIALRKANSVFIDGVFENVAAPDEVFTFRRVTESDTLFIVANLTETEVAWRDVPHGQLLIGNYEDAPHGGRLRSYESAIWRIKQ